MKFDFKQQIKGYIVGGLSAFLAKQLGLPDAESAAVGVVVGGVFDVVYFLVMKWLDSRKDKE